MLEWKDGYSPGSIKVGCNTVFMHKPDLDYYFIQDSGAVTQSENCYLNHQALYDSYHPNLMKFYGLSLPANASRFEQWMRRYLDVLTLGNGTSLRYVDHSMTYDWAKNAGATPYLLSDNEKYFRQIATHPFYELNSVIFSCAQFALYCGASKLIFVGCDVINNIRVGEESAHEGYKITKLIEKWAMFKNAVEEYQRRNKRLVSIDVFRPLGLKELFCEYVVD
jgi:hypothetical protein